MPSLEVRVSRLLVLRLKIFGSNISNRAKILLRGRRPPPPAFGRVNRPQAHPRVGTLRAPLVLEKHKVVGQNFRDRALAGAGTCRLAPLCFSLLLLSSRVQAQLAPTPFDLGPPVAGAGVPTAGGLGAPTPPFSALNQAGPAELSGQFTGGLLVEELNEDIFVTLDVYNRLSFGPVSVGMWLPLRLRVLDRDPDDDGTLRAEDWDEVSDYARLLRFVEVTLGGPTWRFRGRFGALDGESIGHGTIVAGYFNNVDRDHYQGGLAMQVAIPYGGLEFLLDNLLAPEIFGFRLYLRPTRFFSENPWLQKFAIGFSYVSDVRAPVALNDLVVGNDAFDPDIDGDNNYRLTGTDATGLFGFDLEYTVLQSEHVDVVPYVDFNFLFDLQTGFGLHLGSFFNLRLPALLGLAILTRLEYRSVGEGYAPRYVDALYEAQRVMYAPSLTDIGGVPLTKLGWLRTATGSRNGWLAEVFVDLGGFVRAGGAYEDYAGPNNSALTLSLILPAFSLAQLGANYSRRGFDNIGDAFELDGALLLAWARVKMYGPLYLGASYARTWDRSADGTSYEARDNWSVGLSASFSY